MRSHAEQVQQGERFEFGSNWARFLALVDERRIQLAVKSLQEMLDVESLAGKTFLDVGSGSGLFSLAARRLGASVRSFDYDPQSVACTKELRRRYFPGDESWIVEEGSVLDREYLGSLGQWDVVYSWGVLHHTGAMWDALGSVLPLVADGGKLFIAIYNDQYFMSKVWLHIKRTYNRLPSGLRWIILGPAVVKLWGPRMVFDLLRGRPLHSWIHYAERGARGMSAWQDVVDWVGGYPFEVASPEEVFDFCCSRGEFRLLRLKTCGGGIGCNQFVFKREPLGQLLSPSSPSER